MSDHNVSEFITRVLAATTEKFDFFTISNGAAPPSNETQSMRDQLVMYDVLIPCFGLLVIITNLLVVVSSGLIIKKGLEPRCTYLLLGNVALADLITGITVVSGAAMPQSMALRTHVTCCFLLGAIMSSTIASVYSVTLIAIDRFLYILHGMKYHRLVYIRRVRIMIVATWLFGGFIGFLPLMGWSGNSMNGKMCWLTAVAPPKLIIITCIVGILPILLVTVLYSIILYNAIKKVVQLRKAEHNKMGKYDSTKLRMFRGGTVTKSSEIITISEVISQNEVSTMANPQTVENNAVESLSIRSILRKISNSLKITTNSNDNTQRNTPTKWKAIKVVLFVTGSFICTWMPYLIACIVFVFCDFQSTPRSCQKLQFAIASPLAILGFVNSLLNPVIYAWWHNGFRNSIKKMYRKRKKTTILAQPQIRIREMPDEMQTCH